MNKKKLS